MQNIFEKIKKEVGVRKEKFVARGDQHNRYSTTKSDYKKILVFNAPYVFSCDEANKLRCYQRVSIWIEDGAIKELLEENGIKRIGSERENVFLIGGVEEKFDLVYDAGKRGGTVVTPGLINAHAHPPMYLLRSSMDLDEGEDLTATLSKLPLWESKMTSTDLALGTIGDLTEQQKFGVTTTLSHYNHFDCVEWATKLTGQNVINGISVASHVSTKNSPKLIEDLLKTKNDSSSKLAMTVHYLHKASPEVLRGVKKIVDEHGLLFTCHFSETKNVLAESLRVHGMREVEVLEKFGLLGENTLLSHAIHLRKKEIEKLVSAGVGIAHLPTSNTIHKSGVFPYWKFHEAGGFDKIALGTDSVVSKSRLDILTEAYRARTTHLYSRTIKFGSLFKMMTVNGARVLHEPKIGKILPGMKADLVFWKLKDRGFVPFNKENPFSLIGNIITHSGRTARDVMIGGKFVIRDRKHQLVDESKLLEVLQERHMRMRRRVGESL